MDNDTDQLLSTLDEQQKEAVLINSGSLLVFAGAGSGKTRVITTKIAYIIKNHLAEPWQILAVTFTNKACNEMKQRVSNFVGEETAGQCLIRTFHSFGIWLLKRYAQQAGLSPDFSIYDDSDSAALLHQCFPSEQKAVTDRMAKIIVHLKDCMQRPSVDDSVYNYYSAYEKKLKQTGNVDFADMILLSIKLLEENPDIKEYVHRRFKVILVDEYQDSNTAQFKLLHLLAGPETFVCVVGDDDQSIYRFRGAKVENILNFDKSFRQTQKVVLGCNYRCTEPILACARDVIKNNSSRAPKELSAKCKEGKKPVLCYVNTETDEARYVADVIKRTSSEKNPSTAVIYRTNAQSKAFEDCFLLNSIPYVLVGSLRFYEREEIKDAVALISLILNPMDSVSFERMVNKPARGIGNVTVNKIIDTNVNVINGCKVFLKNNLVSSKAAQGLEFFLNAYKKCAEMIGKVPNSLFVTQLITEFGIKDMYLKRDRDETSTYSRFENLGQFVNMFVQEKFSQGLDGLRAFLENVLLDSSSLSEIAADKDPDTAQRVTLITMHNTKGLEFDRVFVVGLDNQIFPLLKDTSSADDLQEERRLCYVAFTRARKELYLVSCSSRLLWGRRINCLPSRFIDEIEPENLEVIDKRDNFFNQNRFNGFYSYGYGRHYNSNYSSGYSSYSSSNKTKKQDIAVLQKNGLLTKGAVLIKKKVTWKVGDRIFNSLLGNGTITEIKKFDEKEILSVSFDNGRTGSFVSEKADFKKIQD